ncbi:hypothetical protein [Alkaliphilus hydrothermalis]|uniref:Uncharacterized protein n=1 Tax=Alkaliphilus hydrothermalis TaxID=1482730 RepID=A0ABS2NLM5_9FIRM|nr:hypothetical protein [Alkaliphilus hydrothermalis]MBM7613834.1 hypothetical protein [Alkaliphilus hydrothermalis]
MHITVSIIVGVIFILTGILLSKRRIYIIRREYIAIFIMLFSTLPIILNNRFSFVWIVFLPMTLLALTIHKGRFTFVNATTPMTMDAVTAILDDKNITHLIEHEQVVLGGHKRLIISFQQSMNTVEMDLREISDLPIYKELLDELKHTLNGKRSTLFPLAGFFMIGLGMLLITMMVVVSRS